MRSLIRSRISRDDAGATIVWVALMMVVLLGMGALVVDVGQLYVERRELQNGADAAALAVAQDCAGGNCRDETTTAGTFADDNAHDGEAAIEEVCGSGPGLTPCATPPPHVPATGWVKVDTVTPDDDKVDFVFAPILGRDSGESRATAVATWGGASSGSTIPVTFSVCDFKALGGTVDGTTFPDSSGYIYTHASAEASKCDAKQNGQTVPGGFGWLDHNASTCKVDVVNGNVDGDTGNNTECKSFWAGWLGKDVLVPLYTTVTGTGSSAVYQVVGFAQFNLKAYCLGGSTKGETTPKAPDGKNWPNCSNTRWLFGEFTRFVTTDQTGGGTDFGVRVIQMIG